MNCPNCKAPIPDAAIVSEAARINRAKVKLKTGPKRTLPTCPDCGKRFRRRTAAASHRCPKLIEKKQT